jgi:hypothetical protein
LNPQKLSEFAMWMGRLFATLKDGRTLGIALMNLTELGAHDDQVDSVSLVWQDVRKQVPLLMA